jgi:hypothetical protein
MLDDRNHGKAPSRVARRAPCSVAADARQRYKRRRETAQPAAMHWPRGRPNRLKPDFPDRRRYRPNGPFIGCAGAMTAL